MTDFFLFARLNLPNVLISVAKKLFDRDFPSPCFDVPKASNCTSGGVQNREIKNRRLGTIVTSFQDSKTRKKQISPTFSYFLKNNALLYHFLANWLAHNKKMTGKTVFARLEVLKWRHNHTLSPLFDLAALYGTGSEIWRFWYIKTRRRKIAIENLSSLYISVHWGDLIEQIKKICHIHFNNSVLKLQHNWDELSCL